MQLYRGMDIGTAKLAPAERRGIPHHQLDVLDVTETATVARYQQAAAADVEAIAARGAVPIVVGGSMLYIQSLLDEWAFPATDPAGAGAVGAPAGRGRRCGVCTRSWPGSMPPPPSILPTDGRRIVRALEVVELTGQPFAASAPTIGAPRWDTVIVGLDWDTALLDERLAQRTDMMFADGLVDEVTHAAGSRTARRRHRVAGAGLRAGARRARRRRGATALAAARERTFIGTRRYVRRQRSWFRRDHRITWLDGAAPDNVDAAAAACGGTYPDQVKFAKGHGTQNDFVLLPDLRRPARR